MIEQVEELSIDAEFAPLAQGEPLRKIKITPSEVRTTKRIPAEISKLAILLHVASGARACTRIDR
jgi:hypothetical protein